MAFDTTEIPAIAISKDCNALLRNRERCIVADRAMIATKVRLLTRYTVAQLRDALGQDRFNALATMCSNTESHLESLDPPTVDTDDS